jgi:pullulanase/glycogen debranching enzyme
VLGMHLTGADGDDPIYVFANAHWLPATFELPRLRGGKAWRRFLDTSLPPGQDALEPGSELALGDGRTYAAGPRSVVILVAK